jgi:hypothetical protein
MRARHYVFLLIRIFALFMVIESLALIPTVLQLFITEESIDTSAGIAGIVSLLFILGIAALLFSSADRVVGKIFAWVTVDSPYEEIDGDDVPEVHEDRDEGGSLHQPISVNDIQAVAFCVLGVWVLSSAIPGVVGYVAYCFESSSDDADFFGSLFSSVDLSFKITTLANLILGLYLFRYSLDLQKFWRGLRRAGVPTEPDGEPV